MNILLMVGIAMALTCAIIWQQYSKVKPSKGQSFVDSLQETELSVRDHSDSINNDLLGDYDEQELIDKSFQPVRIEEPAMHIGALEGDSAIATDGGEDGVDASSSSCGGSDGESEADGTVQQQQREATGSPVHADTEQ